jgi:hypothetical protein
MQQRKERKRGTEKKRNSKVSFGTPKK